MSFLWCHVHSSQEYEHWPPVFERYTYRYIGITSEKNVGHTAF